MRKEPVIRWSIRLASPPEAVYRFLATAEGRSRFWAESAEEEDGILLFRFSNGQTLRSRILEEAPPHRFAINYFGGSRATFELASDGAGGTDLTLTETDVPEEEWQDNRAGWVSVLLALKAAVDFGVDLRNHDPQRTWERGYVDV
ncbi:MAG TPA: SRPBCC domain-containing protein [Thermoanaerobaculia bacterium]|nr:SRPBCC domain-containing protein [Thermoanaerobaculia bacterium]